MGMFSIVFIIIGSIIVLNIIVIITVVVNFPQIDHLPFATLSLQYTERDPTMFCNSWGRDLTLEITSRILYNLNRDDQTCQTSNHDQ